LGTMTMVRGIVLAYTNQRPISGTNSSFLNLSGSSWLGIPIPAFIFFAGVIVSHIILTYNSLGRNCFAIGGNREASIFSGIRVDHYRIIYFTICSFTAAIAGIVLASRLNTASPVYGQDTAIMVVAAVLLGGTSLAGGSGSVIQTLAGVMIIGVLNNQGLIIGIILVVVTILDSYYAKKRKFEAQIIAKRLEFKKELNKGT
jgi:ribose transport system permease protein